MTALSRTLYTLHGPRALARALTAAGHPISANAVKLWGHTIPKSRIEAVARVLGVTVAELRSAA